MKLFLLGAGPLPDEPGKMASAEGLRTSQFLDGISSDISVTCILIEKHNREDQERESQQGSRRIIRLQKSNPLLLRTIRKEFQRLSPDAVVGVNTYPSLIAARILDKTTPFWADLNGWVIAEMQAQAFTQETNAFLSKGFFDEQTILRRADKISVVSTPQKFAVYGELAMLGRLSKELFAYPLVEVVENTCRPLEKQQHLSKEGNWRGKVAAADDFMLVWLGGFNAWADEKTLFEALEQAILMNNKIHFFATGGILAGIDEVSFARFAARVKKSKIAGNIHLLGWLAKDRLDALLCECDAGINVDRLCLETETGARNRLNEMLRYGMPIITTAGTEIAHILSEAKAALLCPSGNVPAIATAIATLADNQHVRKMLSQSQETLIKTRFCATITQKPVERWLINTQCAPDQHQGLRFSTFSLISAGTEYFRKHGTLGFFRKCQQYITNTLG